MVALAGSNIRATGNQWQLAVVASNLAIHVTLTDSNKLEATYSIEICFWD